MEDRRRRRVGHPGMGRLAQQPQAAHRLPRPHTGRVRTGLLRSTPRPADGRGLNTPSLRTRRGGSVARDSTTASTSDQIAADAAIVTYHSAKASDSWNAIWGHCYLSLDFLRNLPRQCAWLRTLGPLRLPPTAQNSGHCTGRGKTTLI